jgi:hypothetical protein
MLLNLVAEKLKLGVLEHCVHLARAHRKHFQWLLSSLFSVPNVSSTFGRTKLGSTGEAYESFTLILSKPTTPAAKAYQH